MWKSSLALSSNNANHIELRVLKYVKLKIHTQNYNELVTPQNVVGDQKIFTKFPKHNEFILELLAETNGVCMVNVYVLWKDSALYCVSIERKASVVWGEIHIKNNNQINPSLSFIIDNLINRLLWCELIYGHRFMLYLIIIDIVLLVRCQPFELKISRSLSTTG